MPRGPRIHVPGVLYHVISRAPSKRVYFRSERDRRIYLKLFSDVAIERSWEVITYSLMSNHEHHLILTPNADLSEGLKAIHEPFTTYVNNEYGEHGNLFGRFKNIPVLTDEHALGCLRYIARNPVEAKMCAAAADWPWGAHPAIVGAVEAPRFLAVDRALSWFDGDLAAKRASYTRFVAKSTYEILGDLARPDSDGWIRTARDHFGIPLEEIARFLGVSVRTVYRRMEEE